jgi:SAM-dependent methyltransferase
MNGPAEQKHPNHRVTSAGVSGRPETFSPVGRDPLRWRRRLHRFRHPAWLGSLRRTTPLSDHWGRERGTPIDRYYIEPFLEAERKAIRGRVLELLNSDYTERFGVAVERSDVLDIDTSNQAATFVADLAAADDIPNELFDCFILTQTLQYVFDLEAAVGHAHRILRPGGTLLCSVPSVSRIARLELSSEYWRLTPAACRRLFSDAFVGGAVEVRGHGNVLSAVAFLMGIAAEELSPRELDLEDPFFPVVVTVRAIKAV